MKALLALTILVAFVALLVNASSSDDREAFRDWKRKFKKHYRNHAEEKHGKENFLRNKAIIDDHNERYDQGDESYMMKLSEHSDLSPELMRKHLGGVKFPKPDDDDSQDRSKRVAVSFASIRGFGSTAEIPEYPKGPHAIDWTELGLVGPVVSQEQCGSCWAFATAAMVEAVMRKKNKSNTAEVSKQQLVDCSHRGTSGCVGGWPPYALDYVRQNGIASEQEIPYEGYERTCEYNKSMEFATVKDVYNVPTRGNETWMKNIVGSVGPIVVNICLDYSTFQNYGGGIYNPKVCCENTDDAHAPVVTGYGTDKKHGDYWIVKNSWGTTWGDNGYAYFKRGNNVCDIGYYAVYAT